MYGRPRVQIPALANASTVLQTIYPMLLHYFNIIHKQYSVALSPMVAIYLGKGGREGSSDKKRLYIKTRMEI